MPSMPIYELHIIMIQLLLLGIFLIKMTEKYLETLYFGIFKKNQDALIKCTRTKQHNGG